ncbi:MAG: cupin domain-containing protein [Cyclobacteriaceae bacterium]|nr:cupin domain-containing protein [Cyclobacteriaceae bacterium]
MNLKESFSQVEKYFWPRIIGEVNDQYIKVVKIKGQDVPWHRHEQEDELFYIVEGELLMEVENQPQWIMQTGDFYVVKKGVVHRVSSTKECCVMLIETKTTRHTGNVESAITKSIESQAY